MSSIERGTGRPENYILDGKKFPSVTTILGATVPKPALVQWAYNRGRDNLALYASRDIAADIGSAVHEAVEEYEFSGAKPDFATLRDTAEGEEERSPRASALDAFGAYLDWRAWQSLEVVALEVPLISSRLGYAGCPDLVARRGGRLGLLDLKTGGAIYFEYLLQLAGYSELSEDVRGWVFDFFGIIRTNKDGTGFEYVEFTREQLEERNVFGAWRRSVEIYNFLPGIRELIKPAKKTKKAA